MKENTSNKDKVTNVVSSDSKQVDKSNPVEDKNIQNAEVNQETYIPTSEVCDTADTVAPIRMLYEMNKNLQAIDRKVRGIDHYVMKKLGYKDMIELCHAFNAEQVDAIAAAITQIENGKAMIIGDMTGIGKGRICAGILRYAKKNGKKPIFVTERPNLFSDIYRDIIAIGLDDGIPLRFKGAEVEKTIEVTRDIVIQSMKDDIENDDLELEGFDTELLFKKGNKEYTDRAIEVYREENFPDQIIKVYKYETNKGYDEQTKGAKQLVPYIVNGSGSKTDIKDSDGNILYKGLPSNKNYDVLGSKKLPSEYDCVLATYSQFSSMKAVKKIEFMISVAKDNIIVMDESHNASGSSRRGAILQNIVSETQGVAFASATYAKRPDNMPIYAIKSNIADAELSSDELITAINRGGVALQEILSSQLVAEGQMIRRQRSYEGIDINYINLDESCEVKCPDFNFKNSHYATADKFLSVIRNIINFVRNDVNPVISTKRQNWILKQCGDKLGNAILFGDKEEREAARELCKADLYNNSPYQGIFTIISQLYFSIKAEALTQWAIHRLHQGKKPIIALASTLESVLDYAMEESEGSKIDVDFSVILRRRLAKALEYTTLDKNENPEKNSINVDELTGKGQMEYAKISEEIENLVTGITISPIDLIKKRIAEAGFTVEEVTGRNKIVEFDKFEESGSVRNRNIPNATDVFNNFNNNVIDCLIINQAGATGASAHAIKTKKVTKVEYENGKPVVPTSLSNSEEVKQRVMIILQAELDVNKEVQKRGRIYRTGQIFNPIYDYLISAIPSEKRLMMMLRKKLRSLDANTSSNQKQSSDILDIVDFLNQYGDEVVVQYFKENPMMNAMLGNIIDFVERENEKGEKELVPVGSIKDLAYNTTGRVALLSTDEQENFYKEIIQRYKSYEAKLTQEGKWNLEVDSLDLQAKTLEKSPISVGNPKTKSVFGGASFLELCEINNIRKPFTKSYLNSLISGMLTTKNIDGSVVNITIEEYENKLHTAIDLRAKAEYDYFLPQYKKNKERELEQLPKEKSIAKIKDEAKRKEALSSAIARVTESYDKKISELDEIFDKAKKFKNIVSFFLPKKVISYYIASQKQDFDGICVGVKMEEGSWLSSLAFSLKIAFPSTLRYMDISFSDMNEINSIINSTNDIYDDDQRGVVGKTIISEWDERIKNSSADRVKRYIVTGNILKAYGVPEISNGQNKLISYSTHDKKVRKGILLAENFKVEELTVKIPLDAAKNIASKSIGSTIPMTFGDEDVIVIVPRKDMVVLRRRKTKKKSYHIEKIDELNQHLDTNWVKEGSRDDSYYEAEIHTKGNIEKAVEVLYKEGFPMNLYFKDFKEIAKNYDITDRFSQEDAIEEMLRKYNENLEKYEKEQESFKVLPESALKKMEDMERELYELRKEKENNKALRFLVDTLSFAEKQKSKEAMAMRYGGELITIGNLQDDETLQLVSTDIEVQEILTHFEPKFNEVDELTKEPYYKNIGGLFVGYKDGNISKVFAYEGTVPSLDKPAIEIFPNNEYFN